MPDDERRGQLRRSSSISPCDARRFRGIASSRGQKRLFLEIFADTCIRKQALLYRCPLGLRYSLISTVLTYQLPCESLLQSLSRESVSRRATAMINCNRSYCSFTRRIKGFSSGRGLGELKHRDELRPIKEKLPVCLLSSRRTASMHRFREILRYIAFQMGDITYASKFLSRWPCAD